MDQRFFIQLRLNVYGAAAILAKFRSVQVEIGQKELEECISLPTPGLFVGQLWSSVVPRKLSGETALESLGETESAKAPPPLRSAGALYRAAVSRHTRITGSWQPQNCRRRSCRRFTTTCIFGKTWPGPF